MVLSELTVWSVQKAWSVLTDESEQKAVSESTDVSEPMALSEKKALPEQKVCSDPTDVPEQMAVWSDLMASQQAACLQTTMKIYLHLNYVLQNLMYLWIWSLPYESEHLHHPDMPQKLILSAVRP
jgi:hypothetical protein